MSHIDKRFPVGKFASPPKISLSQRQAWLEEIQAFPLTFRQVAESLNDAQLNTPYREGGWTARQVIHHVPDSHMNAYLRFRWALTEDAPLIKAYDEKSWADMADYQQVGIENPLSFLQVTHQRWHTLMSYLSQEEWQRTYRHPEDGKTYQLDKVLGMYVWHGQHHLAHLKLVQEHT